MARFVTIPEGELAVALLKRHNIAARLPDRIMATVNPDLLFAIGGVRVIAPAAQIVEARTLMERMRRGEFAREVDASNDWEADAVPGKVGELDEASVHGAVGGAKRWAAPILIFVLLLVLTDCAFNHRPY
ncbi:MAG: hypothetical protein Q8O54_09735 [Brevundimonas sp.]|nr:hypothetical protein [Brevundimonas sp.]